MPPYLPIRAISRSQAVRIGGQTIKTNATSYVDLGNLNQLAAKAALTATEAGAKAELHAGSNAKALVKAKFFGYAVSAVDANGVETPINGVVEVVSGNGAEGEGSLNFIKVVWSVVPKASSYNVYRTGKSQTGLAEFVAETSQPYFLANVAATVGPTNEYLDTGVEVTTRVPVTVNNTNIYPKRAFSPTKELRNHLALGAIIPVGPLTRSNSDWVVVQPETQFKLTFEEKKLKLTKGELRQRSTGSVVSIATEASEIVTVLSAAGKEKKALVVFNTQSQILEIVESEAVLLATKATIPTPTATQVVLYTLQEGGAGEVKQYKLLEDLRPGQ